MESVRSPRLWVRALAPIPLALLATTLLAMQPAVADPLTLSRLPLSFEPNRGQFDEGVRFLCRGPGYDLLLMSSEAVFILAGRNAGDNVEHSVLRMQLEGAAPDPCLAGRDRLPGVSHYLVGNDRSLWRSHLPNYAQVEYDDVFPGIDLLYYGSGRLLEYDFVVHPGADPRDIVLRFDGADGIEVDSRGDLVIQLGGEEVRFLKPVVYQTAIHQRENEVREPVAGGYELVGDHVRFAIAEYDTRRELVIDPVLAYSTYLGGDSRDVARGIAVDVGGCAYVTGWTNSSDFAGRVGGALPGTQEVFVSKINAAGTAIVYTTLFGGDGFDQGYAIAVDAGGRAYVTGRVGSTDFPVEPPGDPLQEDPGLQSDAFLTVLTADGAAIDYSTYLGGIAGAEGYGVAVHANGNAYVTGSTGSANFLVTPDAYPKSPQGAFFSVIDPSESGLDSLVYSTVYGGSSTDVGEGVAVDASGIGYVTGSTRSVNLPLPTAPEKAFDTSLGGSSDAFVAAIDPSLSGTAALVYSTYLGGTGGDNHGARFGGIAADADGKIYVAGTTQSTDFPTTPNALTPERGGLQDAYLTVLDPSRSGAASILYSSYVGGTDGLDGAFGIATDGDGFAYLTGTASAGLPETPGAFPRGNSTPAFLAVYYVPCPALVYASYLSGSRGALGYSVAADRERNAYLVGDTTSPDFPITVGAPFPDLADGLGDGFVTKLDVCEAITLEPGDTLSTTLDVALRRRLFKVRAAPGASVLIELTDPDPADANSIYFAWGEVPCPGSTDLFASTRLEPDQSLLIPWTEQAAGWLLVEANVVSGDVNDIELSVTLQDLYLREMSAAASAPGPTGEILAKIDGAGFAENVTFRLENQDGHVMPALKTRVVSLKRAEVTFDATGGVVGPYTLFATAPARNDAELHDAFRFVGGDRGPLLDVGLLGLSRYRVDRIGRLTLTYMNTGDQDLPAPLFKLLGPELMQLGFENDEELAGNELLIMGADPEGIAGRITPGKQVEVDLIYRYDACDDCTVEFFVHVLSPPALDTVEWAALPPPAGMSAADWTTAAAGLPAILGTTWHDVQSSFAEIATRLSRRGARIGDFRVIFRYAVRQALGGFHAAALGRVTAAGSAAPLIDQSVLALVDDSVVASTRTDGDGTFALDCLAPGASYRIAIKDHSVVSTRTGSDSITVPDNGEDLLFFDVTANPDANALVAASPDCLTEGLPLAAVLPTDARFAPVVRFPIRVVSSLDPNTKNGPGELGDPVPPDEKVLYTISFVNDPNASAAAQTVEIIDWLDPQVFDIRSIEFRDVSVGGRPEQSFGFKALSTDRSSGYFEYRTQDVYLSGFQTSVIETSGDVHDLDVQVELEPQPCQLDCEPSCALDCDSSTSLVLLKWTLTTLTDDQFEGFLPNNDDQHQGEGSVSFFVRPIAGLADQTEIENEGEIIFDGRTSIPTGVWRNTLDLSLGPKPPQFPLPPDGALGVPPDETLLWFPRSNGDVFLWREGESKPPTPQASNVEHYRASLPSLQQGTTYRWQVRARNPNGEIDGPVWSFTTQASFKRGDTNGDGLFDVADPVFSLLYQFAGGVNPTCLDALDFDDDGGIDLSDPVASLNNLFLLGPPAALPGSDLCGGDPTADALSCAEESPPACDRS